MKNKYFAIQILAIALILVSCGNTTQENIQQQTANDQPATPLTGQSGVKDDESQKNIVGVAVSSPDHTTLVAAVQAAELVDVLSNAGPFTVFAPTNSAFEALPAGTVESLLKPENKEKLQDILQYHVAVAVFKPEMLKDGQKLEMVNGGYVEIRKEGEKTMVNDATIIGTVAASNGIIHIIDKVLLPK
ncbi:MAG TPA: fasciclin domain-containing protein [Bacteroidia bacterium]|nr:fasciclin domain-containing protein [Bacteroidia bacterium]